MKKNLSYSIYLILSVLILFEISLRIYNPLPNRIKGGRIELKKNYSTIIKDPPNMKLEREIFITRNSLGLRGNDPPKNFDEHIKIITVGGSTTECIYISDSNTWPYKLGEKLQESLPKIWINNAGLDGHSTFGHQILIEDYLVSLNPDYLIFLVGCNDIGRSDLSIYDKKQFEKEDFKKNWKERFAEKSEVLNTYFNLRRAHAAKYQFGLGHDLINLNEIKNDFDSLLHKENVIQHEPFLISYSKRLENLITICEANNISAILITQPSYDDGNYFRLLELYNEVTRSVANNKNTPLIDLAKLLPKDPIYFYDNLHFTKEGCFVIAEILSKPLNEILKKKKNK